MRVSNLKLATEKGVLLHVYLVPGQGAISKLETSSVNSNSYASKIFWCPLMLSTCCPFKMANLYTYTIHYSLCPVIVHTIQSTP